MTAVSPSPSASRASPEIRSSGPPASEPISSPGPSGWRNPSVLAAVVGIALLLLVIPLLVRLGADETLDGDEWSRYGPTPRSRSAIGFAGLVRLLQEADIPVRITHRLPHPQRNGDDLVLVPIRHDTVTPSTLQRLGQLRNTAILLPKWEGIPDPENPSWIKGGRLIDTARIDGLLETLVPAANLYRSGSASIPTFGPLAQFWSLHLESPQVLYPSSLETQLATLRGTLVGWREAADGRRLTIIADPDLLSNAGLTQKAKAFLALRLIRHLLRPPHRTQKPPVGALPRTGRRTTRPQLVIVSLPVRVERIGSDDHPWPWLDHLYRPPVMVGLFQLGLFLILLIWAGLARFGAPLRLDIQPITGRRALVENAAGLLVQAGHHGLILRRSWERTLAEVGQRRRAPPDFDREALLDHLDQKAQRQTVGFPTGASTSESEPLITGPSATEPSATGSSAQPETELTARNLDHRIRAILYHLPVPARTALAYIQLIHQWKMQSQEQRGAP